MSHHSQCIVSFTLSLLLRVNEAVKKSIEEPFLLEFEVSLKRFMRILHLEVYSGSSFLFPQILFPPSESSLTPMAPPIAPFAPLMTQPRIRSNYIKEISQIDFEWLPNIDHEDKLFSIISLHIIQKWFPKSYEINFFLRYKIETKQLSYPLPTHPAAPYVP